VVDGGEFATVTIRRVVVVRPLVPIGLVVQVRYRFCEQLYFLQGAARIYSSTKYAGQ
jgi:hypothetical protein